MLVNFPYLALSRSGQYPRTAPLAAKPQSAGNFLRKLYVTLQ